MKSDAGTSAGLSKNRDTRGIATESFDVALHPLKHGALVLHAVIAGAVGGVPRPQLVQRSEPEESQAHVGGHKDDIAVRKVGPVALPIVGRAVAEFSSVEVHHHRHRISSVAAGSRRRVNVGIQAVLAGGGDVDRGPRRVRRFERVGTWSSSLQARWRKIGGLER